MDGGYTDAVARLNDVESRTDDGQATTADDGKGGGGKSRLDRELIELLNELRVVLPGVQALFAFLLVVPFSQRFEGVSDLERVVYLVALLASTLACVLFITTPSFHRLRFRRSDKEQLLRIGNRCAIAGLALLAVAMVSAVFLVAEFLFGAVVAVVVGVCVALIIAWLWWVLPLVFGPD
jgi:Family of unknown function (DUF6328)